MTHAFGKGGWVNGQSDFDIFTQRGVITFKCWKVRTFRHLHKRALRSFEPYGSD